MMKKELTLLLFGCSLMLNAQTAYQVNGSFEGEWENCVPWDSNNNTKAYGTQPKGWIISNVPNSMVSLVGAKITDGNNTVVQLTNQEAAGQKVPAYISLGTTWATAETKMTNVRNADGGAFGGKSFSAHPDAIRLSYKRDKSKGEERASVIAYLWTGSWTQKDVPGNTAVGVFSWGSATKVEMENRDRNILGMATELGGEVSHTPDAALVASLEHYITDDNKDEWKELTAEFNYGSNTGKDVEVGNINIIISANDYFGDRNGIVKSNSLTVDNVSLLYYHALKALSYSGATLNFAENTLHYDLSNTFYEAAKLSYTKKGQGAKVSTSFNEETCLLTIRVEGEDYDKTNNAEAYTEYTIQFRKPLHSVLTEAAFDGETVTLKENGTVTVNHIYKKEKLTLVCGSDKDAKVEQSYDAATGILTIKVTGSDVADNPGNVHTYKIQFNLPLHSVLSKVTYKGTDVTLGDNGETHMDGCYEENGFRFFCEADPNAKIEQSYDDATCTLTVKVTGSDVAENPENVHTYKFVFAVSTGIRTLSLTTGYDVYTLSGIQLRKGANTLAGLPKGIYIVNGRKIAIH